MADVPTNRPHIVLVMTDQQRFDTIRALGTTFAETPNLDRLARDGVSFTRQFVTAASCVPSRASFFSGLYPHSNGVLKNGDGWRHSWVEDLADAGYHCVNIGKMHTEPPEIPCGFHERFVVENKDRFLGGRFYFDRWDMALQARGLVKQQRVLYRQREDYRDSLGAFEWELPEETQSDMFVGDLARWWIEQKPIEEPLFLQIGFPGPHPPYDPVPRFASEFIDRTYPLPEVTAEEIALQPAALQALIEHNTQVDHDSVAWKRDPPREQLQRLWAYYHANVAMIDEQVGHIVDALDAKGILEDTVVIFTSDHGDCIGDHGHIQKWTMYEPIVRTPMIVSAPGRFPGGRQFDGLIQQFDVATTILELAGVEVPQAWEGRSVLPVLVAGAGGAAGVDGADGADEAGADRVGRELVFCEQGRDGLLQETAMMTMVRSEHAKAVHFVDHDDGQLFDLDEDPGETRNLWDDPGYRPMKRELLDGMRDWLIRSNLETQRWGANWR